MNEGAAKPEHSTLLRTGSFYFALTQVPEFNGKARRHYWDTSKNIPGTNIQKLATIPIRRPRSPVTGNDGSARQAR
jgi:hypothetical protein